MEGSLSAIASQSVADGGPSVVGTLRTTARLGLSLFVVFDVHRGAMPLLLFYLAGLLHVVDESHETLRVGEGNWRIKAMARILLIPLTRHNAMPILRRVIESADAASANRSLQPAGSRRISIQVTLRVQLTARLHHGQHVDTALSRLITVEHAVLRQACHISRLRTQLLVWTDRVRLVKASSVNACCDMAALTIRTFRVHRLLCRRCLLRDIIGTERLAWRRTCGVQAQLGGIIVDTHALLA